MIVFAALIVLIFGNNNNDNNKLALVFFFFSPFVQLLARESKWIHIYIHLWELVYYFFNNWLQQLRVAPCRHKVHHEHWPVFFMLLRPLSDDKMAQKALMVDVIIGLEAIVEAPLLNLRPNDKDRATSTLCSRVRRGEREDREREGGTRARGEAGEHGCLAGSFFFKKKKKRKICTNITT